MPGELFTAAAIRRLAHEQKASVLVMGPRDLITPEAVDLARHFGIQLVREEAQAAVASPSATAPGALPPLKVARRGESTLQPFGAGAQGVAVTLADVVTQADGAPMAVGYMALDATQPGGGAFAWTLTYDEVDIVLEGGTGHPPRRRGGARPPRRRDLHRQRVVHYLRHAELYALCLRGVPRQLE